MEQYGPPSQRRAPVPPMRVSSLSSSETRTLSSAGRSSEASSIRSGRSAVSFESGHRTSNDSTKPRLSKDQQKFLEQKFAQHQKPNTQAKKVFANDLNVPLEKINNWFQNRRAKSKQDAKKKQEAYQHFMPPHPFAGRHPGEQCFIDPSFYHNAQPNHAYASAYMPVLPGNSCEPHVNTTNAHFGVPLETADMSHSHPFSDQQMMMYDDTNQRGFDLFFGLDDTNDPSAVTMYARQFPGLEQGSGLMDTIPEYDVPEICMNGHQPTQTNGDASFGYSYSGPNDSVETAPTTDFFHPNEEVQNDRYPLRTWGQSAGRPIDPDHHYAGIDNAIASADSELPYRSSNDPNMNFGVTPSSLYAQPSQLPVSTASMETLGLQSHDSAENAVMMEDGASTITSPNSAKEATERRNSTVSRLVESIDNVEVQPHLLEKKASQQSIGHPSLAARRQRRPAPLGFSSARSTSFSSTNPTSPKSLQNSSAEKELRRVRSSIGVMNGRVQKSSHSVSSQRSPHSFTFSDAAASSNLAKSLSSRSMTSLSVDTLSRTNSLVPITPISPPDDDVDGNGTGQVSKADLDMRDSGFAIDDVWANMPNTSDTTSASILSSQVPPSATTDYFENYASPPETPLQSQQSRHVPHHGQADYYWMASSHLGSGPMMQQYLSMTQYPAMMPPGMMASHPNLVRQQLQAQRQTSAPGHNRQASEPIGMNMTGLGVHGYGNGIDQTMPTETPNDSHMQNSLSTPEQSGHLDGPQSRKQSPQSASHQRSHSQPQSQFTPPASIASPIQPGQQPPIQHGRALESSGQHALQLGDSDAANGDGEQHSQHSAYGHSTSARSSQSHSQGLMIQQFSPRDPVDPSRMPPKTKPTEAPKNFLFQTCGPESFSSP